MDVYYLCAHEGGRFRANAEIAEARFYALDGLPTDMLPGQGPILERALGLHRAWRERVQAQETDVGGHA